MMTMSNLPRTRSMTRDVEGTTFSKLGNLQDVIDAVKRMAAMAKLNPRPKIEAPKVQPVDEKLKEQRYLFAVAFTRLSDAAQCDLPMCAEERSFDAYKATCPEAKRVHMLCRRFAEGLTDRVISKPKEKSRLGIILCGKTGTGKTHRASSIYHSLRAEGISPVYMRASNFFALFRGIPGPNEVRMITQFGKISCLMLDEIGRSALSPFEANKLLEVLDARARNGLPTVLVTNLRMEDMKPAFGDAVASRMTQLFFPLRCTWADYRETQSALNFKPEEVF